MDCAGSALLSCLLAASIQVRARTPNLPEASGTLSGLTRSNATPGNIARATVEGTLLNLRGGVEAMRDRGADVKRLLLIGGASASRAVQTIAPSIFVVPVAVPTPPQLIHRYSVLRATVHGRSSAIPGKAQRTALEVLRLADATPGE